MLEIDLHGLTPHQALENFIAVYNAELLNGSRAEIKVVHGYGSTGEGGKIRSLLRRYLNQYEPVRVSVFTGENQDGNPGYTTVLPRDLLPGLDELLTEEILHYCQVAKSEDKISGKFRDYGALLIKKTLKRLESEKKLEVAWKGKYKTYQATSRSNGYG